MTRLTKSQTMEALADDLAIFEIDKDTGKINGTTKSMERMFGFEETAALNGKAIESIVPNGINDQRTLGRRVDGSTFPIRVILVRSRVADDGVVVVVGVVLDITNGILTDGAGAAEPVKIKEVM